MVLKDYKYEQLSDGDKIARLISLEEERGYLLDSEVIEYITLRFPMIKTKWKVYRRNSGRKKK